MHAIRLLHKLLSDSCSGIHKQRLTSLMSGVEGLLNGHRLCIAGLGRSLDSTAQVKHNIKRMDRLAGNGHLHQELLSLYQTISRCLLSGQPRPVLLIDWSDARSDRSLQLLRASAVYDGRSVTVYEEVHPLSQFDNRGVRRRFLQRLSVCLPDGCCPIVITDAGFRVSWYQQIEALGWDWVSRVRGRSLVRLAGGRRWQSLRHFYDKATLKPRALGSAVLTQNHSHPCHLVLVRQRKKGRVKKTIYGTSAASTNSRANAARQTEPWLLASSLSGLNAKQLCDLYKRRMQIESTFRDLKNSQWGFQLRAHRSRCPMRLAVLVLVATLATFVAWLIGSAAVTQNIHREYQANTVKRRVLSVVYLGLQIIYRRDERIKPCHINEAFHGIKQQLAHASMV